MHATSDAGSYQQPQLIDQARQLAGYIRSFSVEQLQSTIKVSPKLAATTHELWQQWTNKSGTQSAAIDSFIGDIYSGLQSASFTPEDRAYANDHLVILSGLYGGLRALDSIAPYRLEMGYKLPDEPYANLYRFWGDSIAKLIPPEHTIVNLSAVEYTKAVLPHVKNRVITPIFLTTSPKTGEPTFVTVHAKIARGAFAHWLIKERVRSVNDLSTFNAIGYKYDPQTSTAEVPVFIAREFKGLGLSVRLARK